VYISRIWGEKIPKRIEPKFCLMVDVCDIITRFKFGDDRLRGLGSAEGQIYPFPLTLMVALTTLSHDRVSVWCHNLAVSAFLLQFNKQ